MTKLFLSGPGSVLSADIAVPEHEQEVRFYSRVLRTGEQPFWAEDLMNNRGMPIIGLGARTPQWADLPLQWMPHIQVADVGASAARATVLGGKELMHHKDENGASQWAVLLDPNGAGFGIIPVVPPEAMTDNPDAGGRVGRIAWLDLTVPNATATREFYREVVGWSVQDVAMVDGEHRYADYVMVGPDGNGAAGVCHARGTNTGIPPVWLIYLPVGDLAESLKRVTEEGGHVITIMHGKDGHPARAVIEDPVGACFALTAG